MTIPVHALDPEGNDIEVRDPTIHPIFAPVLEAFTKGPTMIEDTKATKAEQIAALYETAKKAWDESQAAMARHYDATAEIARLRGETLTVEFDAALAACYRGEPGAAARKDRAYIRLQASRSMDGNLAGVDPKDHAAVLAEVERLRAESRESTAGTGA